MTDGCPSWCIGHEDEVDIEAGFRCIGHPGYKLSAITYVRMENDTDAPEVQHSIRVLWNGPRPAAVEMHQPRTSPCRNNYNSRVPKATV